MPRQLLYFMFAPRCAAATIRCLAVNQLYRKPAARVFSPSAVIMDIYAGIKITRYSGVQAAISALKYVNVPVSGFCHLSLFRFSLPPHCSRCASRA